MSGIVASEQQRVRRDLFREAVVYAKWILADAERKKAFRKSLPGRKQRKVYQAAIQLYMSKQGDKQWLRKQLAVKGMMRAQVSDRPWTPDKQKEAISNRQGTERTVVKVQELVKTGMQVEGIVTYRQGAMSNGQGTIGNGQELMGRMGQQQGTISNKQRCINTEWSMVKMRGRNGKWSINDYEQQGSWRAVWEKRELVKVVRKEGTAGDLARQVNSIYQK
jgi:hypothetical protein